MADNTNRRFRRGGTNPIDDLRQSINDPKEFKPIHKVVPPIHAVTWPKRYFWCAAYCTQGWTGMKGFEQDEVCHAINVPLDNITTRILDEQVIFALVAMSYTREAVVEFFARPDTALDMPGAAVAMLYSKALEQVRAMLYTRADAGIGVRQVPILKGLVHALSNDGAQGAPAADEILRVVYYLNAMKNAESPWPGLIEVQALNPVFKEIPRRDKLYIRPFYAGRVVNQWIAETGHRITPISMQKLSSTMSMYRAVPPPWLEHPHSAFTHVITTASPDHPKEALTLQATALTRSYVIMQLKIWDGLVTERLGATKTKNYDEYLRKRNPKPLAPRPPSLEQCLRSVIEEFNGGEFTPRDAERAIQKKFPNARFAYPSISIRLGRMDGLIVVRAGMPGRLAVWRAAEKKVDKE